jgi:hypothetical protein
VAALVLIGIGFAAGLLAAAPHHLTVSGLALPAAARTAPAAPSIGHHAAPPCVMLCSPTTTPDSATPPAAPGAPAATPPCELICPADTTAAPTGAAAAVAVVLHDFS